MSQTRSLTATNLKIINELNDSGKSETWEKIRAGDDKFLKAYFSDFRIDSIRANVDDMDGDINTYEQIIQIFEEKDDAAIAMWLEEHERQRNKFFDERHAEHLRWTDPEAYRKLIGQSQTTSVENVSAQSLIASSASSTRSSLTETIVSSVTGFFATSALSITSGSSNLVKELLAAPASTAENTLAAAAVADQPLSFTLLKYAAATTTLALMVFCILKKDLIKEKYNNFVEGLPYRLYGKKVPVTEKIEEDTQVKLLSDYQRLV